MLDGPMEGAADTLETRLLRTIKNCSSTVFSAAMRRTLPAHLSPQQFFVLGQLCKSSLQPSELAREHHVGMSAMTGIVDGLVARGLVERRQDPNDRRAVPLEITAEGRALCQVARTAVTEVAGQFLAPLSAPQRQRLLEALGDLEWALDEWKGTAATGERLAAVNGTAAGPQERASGPPRRDTGEE